MISVDWSAVAMGGGVGVIVSAFFFIGLALGVRRALRREAPMTTLALSAVVRIVALLGTGWIVLGQGGPWAALGFALAFIFARLIATMIARLNPPKGLAS